MENEEKKGNRPEDVDRRKFISGAGLMMGSAALLGVGGLVLLGCSISSGSFTTEKCATTAAAAITTATNVEYLGECICPNCGTSVPHPKGTPCRLIPCPKCETNMGRAV